MSRDILYRVIGLLGFLAVFFLVLLLTGGIDILLNLERWVFFLFVGGTIFVLALYVVIIVYMLYGLEKGYLSAFFDFVSSSPWYQMLPTRVVLWKSHSEWWKPVKVFLSVGVLFLSFMVYFIPFAVIFHLTGPPFSTDFGYHLMATFAAVMVMRSMRYTKYAAQDLSTRVNRILGDFILPFVIIMGFLLWGFAGTGAPLEWFVSHFQFILVLFVFYVVADVSFQRRLDKRKVAE